MEFYLFKLDEHGNRTNEPYDNAGYMDIAPLDKGENIRREICLMLTKMGISPESSHHEEGPGQNEIDFRYSDPLTSADNAVAFCQAVKSVAARNGLYADFSPKPIEGKPGNGFHINFSVTEKSGKDVLPCCIAGLLNRVQKSTLFFNPTENSYKRLGKNKAPSFISWSNENRSQLIRIPAASGEFKRAEIRSPDPTANPYLTFALIIYAATEGVIRNEKLPKPADINLYKATQEKLKRFSRIPSTLSEAINKAKGSGFIKKYLPEIVISTYTDR